MAMFNTNEFEFTQVLEAYEILNIPLCSDFATVKKSYKKLSLQYHPDRNKAKGAEEKFKLIANAYQYLDAFKDEIVKNCKEILIFKENESSSTSIDSESDTSKDIPQTKQKVSPEELREQQFAREMAQLLAFFGKNPFPDVLNQQQLYRLLIQEVANTLSNETKQVANNIDDFILSLQYVKRNLIEALHTQDQFTKTYIFEEHKIEHEAKIQRLHDYITAINNDIQFLVNKKSHVALYCCVLESDYNSDNVDSLMGLNAELESLNSRIACIQLSAYYNVGCQPPQQLKLNFLTRLTSDFFIKTDQFREYFTGLDLTNNKLFRLSRSLTAWQSLRCFAMNNSPQVGFPEAITELKNLEKLNLEANNIANLPRTISRLRNLTELKLGKNHLSNLPATFSELRKLNTLHLSDNHFNKIPHQISDLINLRVLNLANTRRVTADSTQNSIAQIPNNLKRLVDLETLNLDGNQIRFIPECVFEKWKKLTNLHIRDNCLTTLPKNFGELDKLVFTDASCNSISFIPSSILKRKDQKFSLNLRNNALNHHQLAVEAVLLQMGWNYEKINTLIKDQSPNELLSMNVDEEFGFDNDTELNTLENAYRQHLQAKETEQRWQMLSMCYQYMPPAQFIPQAATISPLLNSFKGFQSKQPVYSQPSVQDFDPLIFQSILLNG